MSIERRLTNIEKELRPQQPQAQIDVERVKHLAMSAHKIYGDGEIIDWDSFTEADAWEHEAAWYKAIAEAYEVSYEEAVEGFDAPYRDVLLQRIKAMA
jgi:hypothetical protein